MTKIKLNGKKYTVRVIALGQGFAHGARCTIKGKAYESRDVPYGMQSAAVDSLLDRVRRDHPTAELS
ncbi:MAG TPA: hypothetical protein VFS67_21790 [Polyangiaceae bacterium]|nr:hypothetical protein [Polyangiaceae bacterium]